LKSLIILLLELKVDQPYHRMISQTSTKISISNLLQSFSARTTILHHIRIFHIKLTSKQLKLSLGDNANLIAISIVSKHLINNSWFTLIQMKLIHLLAVKMFKCMLMRNMQIVLLTVVVILLIAFIMMHLNPRYFFRI